MVDRLRDNQQVEGVRCVQASVNIIFHIAAQKQKQLTKGVNVLGIFLRAGEGELVRDCINRMSRFFIKHWFFLLSGAFGRNPFFPETG